MSYCFSKPPSYNHLKIFRCLCFSSTLLRDRTKFDPRALPCLFLGYPIGIKGYKLLNLTNQSIIVSRHVIFHEHIFPFASPISQFNSNGCLVLPSPLSTSQFEFHHHHPIVSNTIPDQVSSCPSSHFQPAVSQPAVSPNLHTINPHTSNTLPSVPLRKSTRLTCKPRYLQQYHCNLAAQSFSSATLPKATSESGNPYSLASILGY
jgi:hypothetical protein